jgi:hypothetical protein
MHVNIPKAEPSVDFKLRECVMKKSTTVLASVALGAMLATGSATASMARDSVQKRHIHRAGMALFTPRLTLAAARSPDGAPMVFSAIFPTQAIITSLGGTMRPTLPTARIVQ